MLFVQPWVKEVALKARSNYWNSLVLQDFCFFWSQKKGLIKRRNFSCKFLSFANNVGSLQISSWRRFLNILVCHKSKPASIKVKSTSYAHQAYYQSFWCKHKAYIALLKSLFSLRYVGKLWISTKLVFKEKLVAQEF